MLLTKYLILILAGTLVVWGLWDHDAKMILAGVVTAAIWPMISADIQDDQEKLLDELWDDEA